MVQPGQTMVDIVDSSDLWVIANYRETQLSNIREGADVEMTADAVRASLSKVSSNPFPMLRERLSQ